MNGEGSNELLLAPFLQKTYGHSVFDLAKTKLCSRANNFLLYHVWNYMILDPIQYHHLHLGLLFLEVSQLLCIYWLYHDIFHELLQTMLI